MDLQRAEWKVLEVPDELKATDPAPIAFAPSIVSTSVRRVNGRKMTVWVVPR